MTQRGLIAKQSLLLGRWRDDELSFVELTRSDVMVWALCEFTSVSISGMRIMLLFFPIYQERCLLLSVLMLRGDWWLDGYISKILPHCQLRRHKPTAQNTEQVQVWLWWCELDEKYLLNNVQYVRPSSSNVLENVLSISSFIMCLAITGAK